MDTKSLTYCTRDGKGNDIVKQIPIKTFKMSECDCMCDICGKQIIAGVYIKNAVSGNFTDWGYFQSNFVCPECAGLFSLFPYSYIYSINGETELLNVRQIRDRITTLDDVTQPFMLCLSTSQKKHLFYRAKINYTNKFFYVNLETETIMTTTRRQKALFDFVENLQALGNTKDMLKQGKLNNKIPIGIMFDCLTELKHELENSREIQIPLFCGQKRDGNEEDIICNLISALRTLNEQRQH